MQKVIILLGDLATGKSTYGHLLAKRYNCLILSKDNIKELLGDAIGFKNREENKKLSHGTYAIMCYVLKQLAISKQDIILEANFHKDELENLYQICEEINYQTLTANFTADINILFKRFMHRVNDENRHPVHVTEDLIDFNSFTNYIKASRDIVIKGQKIEIDANDFAYQSPENFKVFDQFMFKE